MFHKTPGVFDRNPYVGMSLYLNVLICLMSPPLWFIFQPYIIVGNCILSLNPLVYMANCLCVTSLPSLKMT